MRTTALPAMMIALLLTACSAPGDNTLPLRPLPPDSFAGTLTLAQQLRAGPLDPARGEMSPALDILLELDTTSVRLAGMAMGQRLLTLNWDGKTLQSQRSALLPSSVKEDRILRDIQFTYWPREALVRSLPVPWTLEEAQGVRTLRWKDQAMIQRTCTSPVLWDGHCELRNLREGYRLQIDSVVQP